MASEIHQFTVTIPAGTAKATPQTTNLVINNRQIVLLGLQVPPGANSLMGFYIARAGQRVIPAETGEFFVWDNVDKEWVLDDYPTAGGWQVVGYNTGVYAHNVIVRMHTEYPASSAIPLPPSVTIQQVPVLSSVVL